MKLNVKNTLIVIICYICMTNIGHAFDLDETVDDEIRKNYNPSKLVNDVDIQNSALEKNIKDTDLNTYQEPLPSLPNISKYDNTKKMSDVKGNTITPASQLRSYSGGFYKLKGGTSFNVISSCAISDWQTKGTKVTFTTKTPVYGRGFTIPVSTVFKGEIVESHQPQFTCNGGLVAIKIYSMNYKGQVVPVDAFITRADDKKIFLNNIKGERTYLKTLWKKGDWGRTLFSKMFNLTLNLGGEGSTFILSPFPLAYGAICLGTNAIISPITAFFSKGGHVSIPAGSAFRIKLNEDVMIN